MSDFFDDDTYSDNIEFTDEEMDFMDDDMEIFKQEMEYINKAMEKEKKKLKKRKYEEGMTLEEVLYFLTKKELIDIADYHEVKGVKGKKKEDMIPAIAKMILDDLDDFIFFFNQNHLEILKELKSHEADLEIVDMDLIGYLDEIDSIFMYLREDKLSFFVPSDVSKKIKTLAKKHKEIIEVNTFIIKAIEMAIKYYGVISIDDLAEIFSKDIFEEVDIDGISELLFTNMDYAMFVEFDGVLIYDSYFEEFDESVLYNVYEKIQENSKRDHRILTGDDFMEYLKNGGANKYSKDLFSLMSSVRDYDDYEVEEFVTTISNMASLGIAQEKVMENLNNEYEDDDDLLESLTNIIPKFYLEQPIWIDKGYSPNYIEYISTRLDGRGKVIPFVRKEDRVGRNDPCPCGSGKKYKKCCLKK